MRMAEDGRAQFEQTNKEEHDLLAMMGGCLLVTQLAEKSIRLCLTYVLQRPSSTAESLLTQLEEERKKTLGYFLLELRKRVDVQAEFDTTLLLFLEMRNTLIHNVDEVPGWDREAPKGQKVAYEFLAKYLHLSEVVIGVFFSLARAWQRQADVKIETEVDANPLLQELENKYAKYLGDIFTAKST